MLLKWVSLGIFLGQLIVGGNLVHAANICVRAKDYADLPLRNARVTIVNLQTNAVSTITTGHDGLACTSQIPEGLYSVEVGLAGFLNVRYYPVRATFPDKSNLEFRLPLGEITEGGLRQDAIVSGTLTRRAEPTEDVEVCLGNEANHPPVACTRTNELGEYALVVPPGKYQVDLKGNSFATQHSTLSIPVPGIYRNRINLVVADEKR